MGTLSIALQLVENRLPPPEQDKQDARRPLKTAITAVESLDALVGDLVDATRLLTGKLCLNLQPVDLVPLAREAVESAQMLVPPGQQLVLTVGAPSLVVHGDPLRLQQILMNLLTNALTYAPNTPRIDIRVRPAEGKVGVAELQVQDYGPGIPPADLPQIFSRFYRVARDERTHARTSAGLGLGLYIVKELVSAQGGEITVSSTEGMGTTFTICFPLLQAMDGAAAARPS